jgi:hypothetical protein
MMRPFALPLCSSRIARGYKPVPFRSSVPFAALAAAQKIIDRTSVLMTIKIFGLR